MKILEKIALVALLCYFGLFSYCQQSNNNFFAPNDRICFVGNSITHAGLFHHNILLYHMTRFPDQPITIFNCGVSGDMASGALNRMDEDILINEPTVAVIMFGMNDVHRLLYSKAPRKPEIIKKRATVIEIYKSNMEALIKRFLSQNIRVILQKPSIYDQTVTNETINNFGVNNALKTCADFMDIMSEKYQLETIDYWTILNRINEKIQQENPQATVIGKDRVHPGATGHLVMAYQFLKTVGAPMYVSKICIDSDVENSMVKSFNCTISNLDKQKDRLIFNVKEDALPFPTTSNQEEGLNLISFIEELNVELLEVKGLKTGRYELKIDNVIIDVFSHKQLSKGVNLALYRHSPQYQQALKVLGILEEIWKMESKLRGLKFIQYNTYFKECTEKENLTFVKTYLDSVFDVKYSNPYYKMRLNDYIMDKPNEIKFKNEIDKLRIESYEVVKPRQHVFSLKRL